VLRGTSGPKRDEVTGEWRELRDENFEICSFHRILLAESGQGA
jgi:hypothetical protein